MMKFRTVMAFLLVPTLWPSSTFAVQGENIAFPRLDGVVQLTNTLNTGNRAGIDQFTDSDDGTDQNSVILATLSHSNPGFEGSQVQGTCTGEGRITAPISSTANGLAVFVPFAELTFGHLGNCVAGVEANPLSATCISEGSTAAAYATSPGLSGGSSASNAFATMDIFMHFLAFGGRKTHLLSYSSAVNVGDSQVEVQYMGDGVFITSGSLAASTEKSADNYVRSFMLTTEGGCLNHFWTARQRVLINSNGQPEVPTSSNLQITTGCSSFIGEDDEGVIRELRPERVGAFIWSANTSAYFFARDYCIDESGPKIDDDGNLVDDNGDPVLDPDPNGDPNAPGGPAAGVVGCHPLKVLIDDGKGGIGTAEVVGTAIAAYHDLKTVTVVVAVGSAFECDFDIFNSKTGQLVAHMDASEATYDATTGMAVFDSTSVGPFEPGLYDVRVGTMYQAEAYVALPGDANLDGTVNILGDAIILVSNLGNSMGVTWFDGDFNCDGVVNTLGDAFLLVANLNQSVCP